jgi:hypothetical protein
MPMATGKFLSISHQRTRCGHEVPGFSSRLGQYAEAWAQQRPLSTRLKSRLTVNNITNRFNKPQRSESLLKAPLMGMKTNEAVENLEAESLLANTMVDFNGATTPLAS